MWLQTCQKMVMWLALTVDRVSPIAERASKLASLVLRIVCGLYIQKGRVGLDWPIKRLGCTRGPSWFKDSRKQVGPRILKWILPFASPSQSRPRPPEPSRRRRRLEVSSAAEAAAIGGVIAAAAALPSLSRSPRSSSRPDLLSPGGNPTGNGASWFLSNVWDSWKVRPVAGSTLLSRPLAQMPMPITCLCVII